MKITAIETYSDQWQCLVRVCAEDGSDGWGMTAPFSADITAQALHRLAAPTALGQDIEDFREIADRIIREGYKFTGSFLARTAAGIDTALWDLVAKRAGLPVAEFAGRRRMGPVELYGSSMLRDPDPLQSEADRLAGLAQSCGFRAFKLHTGVPVGNDQDVYPGCTEEFVRVVRRTIPKDAKLFVDVNGNFTVPRAIEIAHFLKENRVDLYEEPCPYWLLEDLAEVHRACKEIDLPVAIGEQDFMETQWQRQIDGAMFDVAQPDILYIGGFTRALRIAQSCAKKNIPVTAHTSNRSPILVFGLHFMQVVEQPYPFLECGIENDPWQGAAYHNQPPICGGKADILPGPGWGLEINQAWLGKSTRQSSHL